MLDSLSGRKKRKSRHRMSVCPTPRRPVRHEPKHPAEHPVECRNTPLFEPLPSFCNSATPQPLTLPTFQPCAKHTRASSEPKWRCCLLPTGRGGCSRYRRRRRDMRPLVRPWAAGQAGVHRAAPCTKLEQAGLDLSKPYENALAATRPLPARSAQAQPPATPGRGAPQTTARITGRDCLKTVLISARKT